ncbi:hypothetical protein TNCT_254371 [Trichonephila clavata]|uniref:Uncharacterized protein n=1 Tax=Trichonephila clavata TaxID=2740835 RepID=A0A8X6LLQ8_TRICU|nr:hypothetical protein TNCT_254371 [Trichonephila clavata]
MTFWNAGKIPFRNSRSFVCVCGSLFIKKWPGLFCCADIVSAALWKSVNGTRHVSHDHPISWGEIFLFEQTMEEGNALGKDSSLIKREQEKALRMNKQWLELAWPREDKQLGRANDARA